MSAKKLMLVGGGSGGHITPNLAVAEVLGRLMPDCKLLYVIEKDAKFASLLTGHDELEVHTVLAGKLRRYHGESWLKRLFDVKTNLLNVRDSFRIMIGVLQAWRLLKRERPEAILIKGGFVAVPVGLAAAWLHIPFITHDSDSLPGLANRLISRWARYHATGMPPEFYSYPPAKMVYVGVPCGAHYQLVTAEQQTAYRLELGLPTERVICIAGGSNGAENVNLAFASVTSLLLEKYPDLTIVHQVGRDQLKTYADLEPNERLIAAEFFAPEDMVRYSGAANLVVSRAGATNIAEFALQAKACLIIPNPLLTGGHQVKNAEHLATQGAIEVFNEADLKYPELLLERISSLLADPRRCRDLATHLGALARPQAAKDIAELLLKVAEETK